MTWLVMALYVLGAMQSALLAVAIDRFYPPERRWAWQALAFIGAAWPIFAVILAATCRQGIGAGTTPSSAGSVGGTRTNAGRPRMANPLGQHKGPAYNTEGGLGRMGGGLTPGLAEPSTGWMDQQASKCDPDQMAQPK